MKTESDQEVCEMPLLGFIIRMVELLMKLKHNP